MSIDSILRETLRSHADHAPSNAGLLDEVRVQGRRRRNRRNLLAAGAAVVTVSGLAGAATVFYGGGSDGTAAPAASAVSAPYVPLSEPSFDLPPFPFSPGWTPDGLAERYVFYNSGLGGESSLAVPEGRASFSRGPRSDSDPPRSELTMVQVATDPEVPSPLWAEAYATDPTAWLESISVGESDLRVQGRPATSYQVNDGATIVAWRQEPGLWMGVVADQSRTPEDAARYAQELTPEPTAVTVPFDFELLPAGMDLAFTSFSTMSFRDEHEGWLDVQLWRERDLEERPTEQAAQVEINGRRANLMTGANGSVLYILLEPDLWLEVRGTLNRYDLVRVAEGMTPTPDTRLAPTN